MLFSKRDLPLAAALVCLVAPSTGIAATDSPEAVLNKGLAELLRQTKGRNNTDPVELAHRLRPTIERFFNMESLTRKALGVGWKEFSPAQQKQAVDLFSEMMIRSYTSRFDPSSEIDVQFVKSIDLGNGRKEVPATARYQGNSVVVAYRVENNGPEGWRVYDVVVEGVSLASNYRAQFDAIRQKGGPEAVIQSMEAKLK
ncbi:MAG: ABC transporter substrate-binding protein [Verrucomicrobiota bacterium]